jgi:tetratricopeptide (TPR) repeat protein
MTMKEELPGTKGREVGAQEVALAAGLKSSVFVQLAEAFRSQGRYEEAIVTCRKGLEKMPDALRGRLLLGKCYLEKTMIPQAREELEKVAREIEECFSVYKLLSLVYLHEKNPDKALEALKKSLSLPPAEGSSRKSVSPLETVLPQREPKAPLAAPPRLNHPRLSRETEKPAGMEKAAPSAIRTDTLAEIYIKQGKLDRALSVYQEILTREPENTAVREKYEGLQKRLAGQGEAAPQKRILNQLERWLSAISSKAQSPTP